MVPPRCIYARWRSTFRDGQRVITSPITFVASANCIRYCGGEVDFVDVDPKTALLDLDLLEKRLQSAGAQADHKFAGVIPVDFAGTSRRHGTLAGDRGSFRSLDH